MSTQATLPELSTLNISRNLNDFKGRDVNLGRGGLEDPVGGWVRNDGGL